MGEINKKGWQRITFIWARRGTLVKAWVPFSVPENRKEKEMKDKQDKTNDEVIMVTDETGMQLYLSEKAANRLSWILTGLFALISLPVFILAFMCM